jgi:hypothetical protein
MTSKWNGPTKNCFCYCMIIVSRMIINWELKASVPVMKIYLRFSQVIAYVGSNFILKLLRIIMFDKTKIKHIL